MQRLVKTRFSRDLLPAVSDFDCGDEPFQREVSDWIRDTIPGGVSDALQRDTDVWLYSTEEGDLVGFGSLCRSLWSWPKPNRKRDTPISLIPMLGIDRRFWGKPEGPNKDERFSTQIIQDLIHEARQYSATERLPLLGLFVHPDNVAAIKLYERIGFMHYSAKYKEYKGMVLKLEP